MENKKTPQIRFSGFTDDWEQRKLGELFDERIERSAEGELISVTIGEGIKKFSELGRHDNSSEDKSNYKKVEIGDIAYNSMRMWQGASGYSPYKGILSPAYTVCIPKDNTDSLFFSYMFKKKELIHQFEINSQGLTKDTWNLKFPAFSQIDVFVPPSKSEQARIGVFFRKLDDAITLHQRKCEKLKKIKTAFLSDMFPKNGESVPKRRFAGFSDAWEQRKLGEVCQITMGQSPDGETYSDSPSDYILVQGNADLVDGYVVPRIWTTQKTKTAQAGDLIMSVRAPAGAMGKTLYDIVLGRGVAGIKGNEFIFQSLVKLDSDGFWKKLSCGSTFDSLNSEHLYNAEIKVPSTAEQVRIGTFFRKLDDAITLHQRKCEKLKKIKSACLKAMFV